MLMSNSLLEGFQVEHTEETEDWEEEERVAEREQRRELVRFHGVTVRKPGKSGKHFRPSHVSSVKPLNDWLGRKGG